MNKTADKQWIIVRKQIGYVAYQKDEEPYYDLPTTLLDQLRRETIEDYKKSLQKKVHDCNKQGHEFSIITATHYICNFCGKKEKVINTFDNAIERAKTLGETATFGKKFDFSDKERGEKKE